MPKLDTTTLQTSATMCQEDKAPSPRGMGRAPRNVPISMWLVYGGSLLLAAPKTTIIKTRETTFAVHSAQKADHRRTSSTLRQWYIRRAKPKTLIIYLFGCDIQESTTPRTATPRGRTRVRAHHGSRTCRHELRIQTHRKINAGTPCPARK